MNEPRECPECDGTGMAFKDRDDVKCPVCNGTGLVWPSVKGEIVVHDLAQPGMDEFGSEEHWMSFLVPEPGEYRIIVQPLEGGS